MYFVVTAAVHLIATNGTVELELYEEPPGATYALVHGLEHVPLDLAFRYHSCVTDIVDFVPRHRLRPDTIYYLEGHPDQVFTTTSSDEPVPEWPVHDPSFLGEHGREDGTRALAVVFPFQGVHFTPVCPGENRRSIYGVSPNGVETDLVIDRCNDGSLPSEMVVSLRGRNGFAQPHTMVLPPVGSLPDDERIGYALRVREAPAWRPGFLTGVLLFGLVPFLLGWSAVAALSRRRRRRRPRR